MTYTCFEYWRFVAMDGDYRSENDRSRERLFALTEKLGEAELALLLPNGWTLAGALAHMAFWDIWDTALLGEWEKTGCKLVPGDVPAINEAVDGLAKKIPAANVVALVREAAEAADRKAAGVGAELAAAIEASGQDWACRRSLHREAHLKQIEEAIAL